jgi:hypothetical protein
MDDESQDTSTLKTEAENLRWWEMNGESQGPSATPQSNMRSDVWRIPSARLRDEERLRPMGPTGPWDIRNNVVPRWL